MIVYIIESFLTTSAKQTSTRFIHLTKTTYEPLGPADPIMSTCRAILKSDNPFPMLFNDLLTFWEGLDRAYLDQYM